MKKQSIKSNLLFQGMYQLLILGVPLVVSPYLTRTLGAKQLGIYTYTNSIAYYFVILAMLGINRHGQRVIAAASDDEVKLRKTFWSLYLVHAFFSIVALVCYMMFIAFFDINHKMVFWIQGLYVLSALFDITWLFYGVENFKSVVIKNTVIKLFELVCIFVFVKSSDDLYIYTGIMVASMLIGQIIMVPQMLKIVKPVHVGWSDCIKHVKPLLLLSISVIAVSLYTVFDKTLLGILLDMERVSYYEYAYKIINIPTTLLGVITSVLFPRVCKIAENDKSDVLSELFNISFFLTGLFGIGVTFILIGVSRTFAPLYYGEDFAITGDIIIVMAAVIVIVSLGDVIRTQLMIPKHKDGPFVFCVVTNAVVNLILSVPLIHIIGIYGAVAGSVMAELCGLILETWFCRHAIKFKSTYLRILPFVFIGAIALVPMQLIENNLGHTFMSFILQAFSGCVVYGGACLVYMYVFQYKFFELIIANIKKVNK